MSKKNTNTAANANASTAASNETKAPETPKAPEVQTPTLSAEMIAAAQAAAKKFGKRGRPLTHVITGQKGNLNLFTVDGTHVEKFDKIDPAWDKVRALKASTVPMIKCWKVNEPAQIYKKIKEEAPAAEAK